MKTITPQPDQMMTWQDVKDWVASMSETELAQPAFVYTGEFERSNGTISTEQSIIGSKAKTLACGFKTPRLIAETAQVL